MRRILSKIATLPFRILAKMGRLLFHRMGVMAVLILLQIVLYGAALIALRDSEAYAVINYIMVALSVVAVFWVVGDESNPGYKIGWIIVILAFVPFGGLAYLLLGGNHLSQREQRKLRAMERRVAQQLGDECGRSAFLADLLGEDAGRMARYLEQTSNCPVYGNTATKYYPLGDVCHEDILSALRAAERYIFIEYFIIEEGVLWNSVLEILKEKAAAGVEVRVIYDDIGSIFTLPGDYPKRLEKLGIKCRVFNRLVPIISLRQNNRDHRKYMIIDGRVAFTGGINMADEYINAKKRFGHWKDSAIRLEGDAVWSMTVSFLTLWDFTASQEERLSVFRPEPSNGGAQGYVQPYHDCPWDNEPVGQTVYLNLINRAKKYVYITTPYLVIDYSMNMALTAAAKSGVDVCIITPHIPDKKTVFEVTRAYYRELLAAGVRIYEYEPGFIHSKNFVVDDLYAVVGTVNMDYRSMFLHFENGVLLYDTPSVADVRSDFLDTQKKCIRITYEDCLKVPFYRRVFRAVLRVFATLF